MNIQPRQEKQYLFFLEKGRTTKKLKTSATGTKQAECNLKEYLDKIYYFIPLLFCFVLF